MNIWLGGFIGILMSYIDRVSHIHKQKRRVTDMTNKNIYQNIAARTGGDIYLGVVGPVRTGKSTFIKRFMDLMVLPRMEESAGKQR